jgi:AraC-like DNA-binding protein
LTVTLLRCDTYQWQFAVPDHQRTHGGVLLIREGRGRLSIDGREHAVEPGDVALYLPFESHGYRPADDGSLRAIMVNYELRPRTKDSEAELAPLGARRVFSGIDDAQQIFAMIGDATRRGGEYDLRSAESLLVSLLYRLLGTCRSVPAQSRSNPIDAAMERLYTTYTARLNEVAGELGVSAEAIRKQFQKHFGDSPMRYFAGYHVQRLAAILESSDAPLRELAEEFGFYDEFHLSRVFKRYTGMSPTAYRRAHARGSGSSQP